MNLREAAQQALEYIREVDYPPWDDRQLKKDLEAALAEPEHEIIQRMRKLKAEAQAEQQQAIEQGKCPSCMQPLPEELKTEYAMQRLTDVQQEMEAGCAHCNSPMWCGTKCKSCGKVWKWASGIDG